MRPTTKEAYEFFHKGTEALSQVEANGIKIDTDYLDKSIARITQEIEDRTKKLHTSKFYEKWQSAFGSKTNVDSTQQMAHMLFTVEKFKPTEFTDTKKAKVDEYSLRNIDHPFLKDFFAVKKLKKVVGTYLKGIRREVDYKGYLHCSYNLAGGIEDDVKGGALSYRGSSSQINFQNIPIRNPEMKKLIRPCFIARRPNRRLVTRDFAGIEVRINATYSHDPTLIKYIKDKTTDMHRDQACVMFCLKPDQVVKSQTRDCAKNQWVFPQFYGSVWFQCAPAIWEAMVKRDFRVGKNGEPTSVTIREHLAKLGITKLGDCEPGGEPKKGTFAHHLAEAEKKLWNERFPKHTKWRKDYYQKYLETGYCDMYTGFRCEGYFRRNQVINFPVQGSAFHCLLWCVIKMQEAFRKYKMKSLIVGQIHDDILGDVPDDELQDYLDITQDITEVQLPKAWKWINVPIETEAEVCPMGGSWLDKQVYVPSDNGWVLKT